MAAMAVFKRTLLFQYIYFLKLSLDGAVVMKLNTIKSDF